MNVTESKTNFLQNSLHGLLNLPAAGFVSVEHHQNYSVRLAQETLEMYGLHVEIEIQGITFFL